MTEKDKTFDDVNIRHFKLVNGEEVISYVGSAETAADTLIHLDHQTISQMIKLWAACSRLQGSQCCSVTVEPTE